MSNAFDCETCYDTGKIDGMIRGVWGEMDCPSCKPAIQFTITGLGWGLGLDGDKYATASKFSKSTITFTGYRNDIMADVMSVRRTAEVEARRRGLKGRNSVSSGAIAIEKRVREALS